jgi:DNA polymerase III subunit theta
MSNWNIAAKSKEDQDKVNVDLAASGVAYKERLNMPVSEQSIQLPRASDPRYIEMAEQNAKK